MKFLHWLFSFTSRHITDINRYEKDKLATRIIVIILDLFLLFASLALEIWCINLFNDKFLFGVLELIFLLIPISLASLDTYTLYIYLGFKSFASKKIDSAINDLDSSINEQNTKNNRGLDLFVGIFSILCLALLVAWLFIIPSII